MDEVDVLICGGGPVGLLTGYCLARYGLKTFIVEQQDKIDHATYGGAAMIAPRSIEMFEQLDLAEEMLQMGFIVRGQVSYKDGQSVDAVTYASSNITDTFVDHLSLLSQKYTEAVIRDGYSRYERRPVHHQTKLLALNIGQPSERFRVTSTLQRADGSTFRVKSRYLVGADGSRSSVRELAGIRFDGEKNTLRFIRIDGVVKTDMPHARRGLAAVSSKSHGNIMLACLDHGRTRVGFSFPEKLYEELGSELSKEDVVREAQKGMEPFKLEFERIDWWTAYAVGQRLASTYQVEDCVFIAGDAAHTHSSAGAQGMNSGIHDAVNLAWKLAGFAKGWFKDCGQYILEPLWPFAAQSSLSLPRPKHL